MQMTWLMRVKICGVKISVELAGCPHQTKDGTAVKIFSPTTLYGFCTGFRKISGTNTGEYGVEFSGTVTVALPLATGGT